MASKNKQSKVRHAIETLGSFGEPTGIARGVKDSLKTDLGINGGKDFLQFLGVDMSSGEKAHPKTSNSEHGNEIDLIDFKKAKNEKAAKPESRIEAAIDYSREIVHAGEHASKQETHSFKNEIEQIKVELINLSKSAKMLELEFASVSVEQTTNTVGTYHQNFFEWMLIMIRGAREKVETSEAWMSAQKNKSGKKSYWGMFKKHGTSFAMSNERGVATQVG